MASRTVRRALLGFSLLSVGCAVEPAAIPIVGPDGSRMLHVSCGADEGRCFELAGRNCPFGYDMYAVHPPSGETFLVRCRYGTQPSVATVTTTGWSGQQPPAAPASPSTGGRSTREPGAWPPTGEPDTVSPWPPAGTPAAKPAPAATASSGAIPPMSGLPGSPDDIGY